MIERIPRPSAALIALVLAAIASALFLAKDVDLRVYWLGVNGFFSGTRPAYGPRSGLGFPMEYRYPPVTYLLLYPLRFASLRVAGFWWMLAAWANALWSSWLAIQSSCRAGLLRFSSGLCCLSGTLRKRTAFCDLLDLCRFDPGRITPALVGPAAGAGR